MPDWGFSGRSSAGIWNPATGRYDHYGRRSSNHHGHSSSHHRCSDNHQSHRSHNDHGHHAHTHDHKNHQNNDRNNNTSNNAHRSNNNDNRDRSRDRNRGTTNGTWSNQGHWNGRDRETRRFRGARENAPPWAREANPRRYEDRYGNYEDRYRWRMRDGRTGSPRGEWWGYDDGRRSRWDRDRDMNRR